ncbi:MAG: DNA repair protein RecN [Deltaproteobacteria bacterium]|nr:DNA repair protein RecN [Deltaproteobacteria bacterium]
MVLRIRNLAIIEELEVEFGPGLNVITGETGAGKSVLLKAIELLGGKRSSSNLIREGAEACEVEALFVLDERARKSFKLEEDLGLDIDIDNADDLLIRRILDRSGRSKFYINGRLSTANCVQRVSGFLFDITAQNQAHLLVSAERHREFLDQFGVSDDLLSQVAEAYGDWGVASRKLGALERQSADMQVRVEQLSAQVEEIRRLDIKRDERRELEIEVAKLSSVELLAEVCSEASLLLEDDSSGICAQLSRLEERIALGAEKDPTLAQVVELIEPAVANIGEVLFFLQSYSSKLEEDPTRIENLRDRLAEIGRLERKHGKAINEILSQCEDWERELAELSGTLSDPKHLRLELEQKDLVLKKLEKELSAERRKAAQALSRVVEAELCKLNMAQAKFIVEVSAIQESSRFGRDYVRFLLAANPGQPACPLADVASGGELSRILLVLKTIINERESAPLQIFDEIDVGVGGAVAHVVGEKLKKVAEFSQVISITHAPQIASLAEHHFVIRKDTASGETRTSVSSLSNSARVDEIARMLAGKRVTKEFKQSAMKLLGFNAEVLSE